MSKTITTNFVNKAQLGVLTCDIKYFILSLTSHVMFNNVIQHVQNTIESCLSDKHTKLACVESL